ncbi:MAG TPA: MFS transporter [Acidimicrobiales bacterium]|nr:MFS transporter [Acidimicrobiales bacterium]
MDAGEHLDTSRSQWWTLVAVCGATFMLLVDVTIVQVALPTIQREFAASFSDLQWVIDAYALMLASLILTSGSLADRYGRKFVFIAGLVVFTVASFLCGVAPGSTFLIGARALQGVGGAAMFATGLALIGQEYAGPARAKAIAAWGATVGAAVGVGPLIGGVITDGLGWRWVFFVNVPVGIVTVALAAVRTTNKADPDAKRLDVAGVLTFSGALFLFVLALVRGTDDGWGSTLIVSLFVGAAVLLASFVVIELRQARPMFDMSLFRKPAFTGVSIGTFAVGAGMFAAFPYITFYLQNGLGYSPLQGGLRLLPSTIPCFIVPLLLRRTGERTPAGPMLGAGLALVTLGEILMATMISATSSWTALLPGLVISGIGIGIANPTIAKVALGVVPPQRSGMASGISNTFRIAGLATGVAALGALFQDRLTASLSKALGRPAGDLAKAVASRGIHATVPPRLAAPALEAYVTGTSALLLAGGLVVAVGALAAVVLIRSRDMQAAAAGWSPQPAGTSAEEALEETG